MKVANWKISVMALLMGVLMSPVMPVHAIEALPTDVTKPHHDHLDGMIKRREIRVLVHWSKTDYFIDKGQQHGIAWEMSRDFEKFINKELHKQKTPISVVMVPVSRDKLVTFLEQGRGDISFSGMRETPELKGRIAFSAPIATNVSEIVMRHKSASPINTEDDLSGKVFHLRPSSKYLSTLKQINSRLVARNLPEAQVVPLSEHLADADILEIMDAGLIEYTILDGYRGDFWASIFPHVIADHAYPLAEKMPVSLGLRPGTPKLKALLDKFIQTHRVGTAYGNTLVRRYFKTNPWARKALGKEELRRFESMVKLFEKYGSKYGFDPLMITAQGFQESGLNQKRRSRVGAVGVMQVMPATGRSLKVGDIRKLEPNIHAGVKYMDHMAEVYFSDPAIDPVNRTLFCFAAYNAGPSRISRLRKVAAARGLDPNVWFDNVELVVAEKVSHETVQYVVNISKYYVAYKLLEEQTRKRENAIRATIESTN